MEVAPKLIHRVEEDMNCPMKVNLFLGFENTFA